MQYSIYAMQISIYTNLGHISVLPIPIPPPAKGIHIQPGMKTPPSEAIYVITTAIHAPPTCFGKHAHGINRITEHNPAGNKSFAPLCAFLYEPFVVKNKPQRHTK